MVPPTSFVSTLPRCYKAFKVVFNSDDGYDELLQMNNEITIHQKHLHVFKSLNNPNPKFMWSYFAYKNITYNIRNGPLLRLPDAKSTYYGIIIDHFFRPCLLWNGLPRFVKHSESILTEKET